MKFLKKHAVSIFVTVLCLVTLILLFFKCVALDVSILDLKFTGFEVIFGLTETQGSVIELNVAVLDFSLMAFFGIGFVVGRSRFDMAGYSSDVECHHGGRFDCFRNHSVLFSERYYFLGRI